MIKIWFKTKEAFIQILNALKAPHHQPPSYEAAKEILELMNKMNNILIYTIYSLFNSALSFLTCSAVTCPFLPRNGK